MIGRNISQDRILEHLGGLGVVCKAKDTRLGRNLVLKFLPPEMAGDRQALDRFQQKARARIPYAQQHFAAAIRLAKRAIERQADSAGAHGMLARSYFASSRHGSGAVRRKREGNGGERPPGIATADQFSRTSGQDCVGGTFAEPQEKRWRNSSSDFQTMCAGILLACHLASLGQNDDAVQHVKIAMARLTADANILDNAACGYEVMRMKAEAMSAFRRCIEADYYNSGWATKDSDHAILHDDPEFLTLIVARPEGSS